ncbi:MAG: DNA-directed RNA polymerase, subunit E'' [Candidatus Altiarchaeota archaeon]|nr:DNA-directed RNA polymerase, subunit E'' [Candidatus Altiarchaeota archaeon]
MADKKVCRKCRLFVKEKECPICKGDDFSMTWAGMVEILDPETSEVAKKMGITVPGRYALKVR